MKRILLMGVGNAHPHLIKALKEIGAEEVEEIPQASSLAETLKDIKRAGYGRRRSKSDRKRDPKYRR